MRHHQIRHGRQGRQQQRGMTMWGLLFVLGVLAFVLFIGFKLFPPYLEDFKVKAALDSLARQPDFSSMSRGDMAGALDKRFDIDDITGVNLSKDLTVETQGRLKRVRIRYEKVVPIVANISLLLEFEHSKETRSSE
jgi:uncharacterized protein DUF4845